MKKENFIEKTLEMILIAEFNFFIKKWTLISAHLLDNDENDGERFRNLLRDSIKTASEFQEAKCQERMKQLEKFYKDFAEQKELVGREEYGK